jgi:integrase
MSDAKEDRTLAGSRGRFSATLEGAKIQEHTCHCTHPTFASRLVVTGVDLWTIAELLGHRTLQMVMRYSHLAPEHQASVVDRLVSFGNTRDTTADTGEFGVKRCKTPKHANR